MKAPLRQGDNPIVLQHEKTPGHFYQNALKKIAQFLGGRGGAVSAHASKTQWRTYLQSIVLGRIQAGKYSEEEKVELQTLARCLDALGEGGLDLLADTLTQRFKSVEARHSGAASAAKAIELVGIEDFGLISRDELVVANQVLLRDRKLKSSQRALGDG